MLGVVLVFLVFFLPVLYIPAGMVFGVMTSMDWAKQVADAAGVSIGDLYLWFAADMVICYLFSRGDSGWGPGLSSIPASVIILSLFVIFGLLQFEGPAAYIAQTVMPLMNSWSVRVGAVLAFAILPNIWMSTGFSSLDSCPDGLVPSGSHHGVMEESYEHTVAWPHLRGRHGRDAAGGSLAMVLLLAMLGLLSGLVSVTPLGPLLTNRVTGFLFSLFFLLLGWIFFSFVGLVPSFLAIHLPYHYEYQVLPAATANVQ